MKSEETIFAEATGIEDADARAAYLEQACGDDAALRHQVEGLLAAHDRAAGFMQAPASSPAVTSSPDSSEAAAAVGTELDSVGAIVGPYKLLERIGEGGMAVVFLAEQSRPIQRKVALKVIKPGMDSRQVVARFEAERQALALMDHANIAKVLEAGTTDAGRPYFVMELVKGVPITRYCDEHHLTPRDRLAMFVQVCAAVQHAHQKGIIHRDLKPSNVLVAQYDGRPVPKVIDFGIAKATGQQLTERTLFTGLGAVVGTPEYMSPEQAEMNQLDVDTRSDVYSLGVLLYELLTGSTPLRHDRFKAAALLEMLRIVREEEPPRPSTRLSTSDGLPAIAANRGLEPKKLSALVHGELDWIVMKALEKDRDRRYETASSFAADVRRYLEDEAVHACPPSGPYRVKKFVRRHRWGVLAGSAIAGALVVGLVAASIGFLEARRQARIAREEVANTQLASAKVYNVDGKGNSPGAERLARAGLATRKALFGEHHPKVGDALHVLAMVVAKSRPEEAISLERQAIPMLRKSPGPADENGDLAWSLDQLAGLLLRKGEAGEAETLYREALPIWRKWRGNENASVANTLDHLAAILSKRGELAEAEICIRECLAIRTRTVGPQHSFTINSQDRLIEILRKQGKDAEADKLVEEMRNRRAATNKPDGPSGRDASTTRAASAAGAGRDGKP